MYTVMITSKKWHLIKQRLLNLKIDDNDLTERFILGQGKGGQKKHKSSSCVQLQHTPSNISIKCEKTRSRDDNRYFARKRLCDKIEELQQGTLSDQQRLAHKIKRQKAKRSKRARAKIRKQKEHRSALKSTRTAPEQ